jgi:PAS domain S-box-containing protein
MPGEHDAAVRRLGAAMRRADPRAAEVTARLERFDVAVLVANDEGRYVAANQRAAHLTGFTVEELLTLTVADLTPVPYGADSRTLWKDFVVAGVQRGTYQLRRQDGSVVAVHYAAWANLAPGVHVSVLTASTSMR